MVYDQSLVTEQLVESVEAGHRPGDIGVGAAHVRESRVRTDDGHDEVADVPMPWALMHKVAAPCCSPGAATTR